MLLATGVITFWQQKQKNICEWKQLYDSDCSEVSKDRKIFWEQEIDQYLNFPCCYLSFPICLIANTHTHTHKMLCIGKSWTYPHTFSGTILNSQSWSLTQLDAWCCAHTTAKDCSEAAGFTHPPATQNRVILDCRLTHKMLVNQLRNNTWMQ